METFKHSEKMQIPPQPRSFSKTVIIEEIITLSCRIKGFMTTKVSLHGVIERTLWTEEMEKQI